MDVPDTEATTDEHPRRHPGVTPSDWQALNALADGELRSSQAAMLRRRISSDERLAAELSRIEDVKADIRRWQSATGAAPGERRPRGRRLAAYGLAGAVLVLVGALSASMLQDDRVMSERSDAFYDPLALHLTLAANTDLPVLPTGSGTQPLDLSSAGLTLTRDMLWSITPASAPILVRHYRGRNGCRLTHLVGAIAPAVVDAGSSDGQIHRWAANGVDHMLVSQGMDAARFASIAADAEAMTQRGPVDTGLRMAKTRTARCLV